MKISDVPELYKIYTVFMTSKSEYEINGVQKQAIMDAETLWVDLPNGTSINKAYAVEIRLNKERTRENIQKHAEKFVFDEVKKTYKE